MKEIMIIIITNLIIKIMEIIIIILGIKIKIIAINQVSQDGTVIIIISIITIIIHTLIIIMITGIIKMMILGQILRIKSNLTIIKIKRRKIDGLQNWIIILMDQKILKRRKMKEL